MLTIYFDGTDNALKGFVAKLNQIFINKLDNGHLFFFSSKFYIIFILLPFSLVIFPCWYITRCLNVIISNY